MAEEVGLQTNGQRAFAGSLYLYLIQSKLFFSHQIAKKT